MIGISSSSSIAPRMVFASSVDHASWVSASVFAVAYRPICPSSPSIWVPYSTWTSVEQNHLRNVHAFSRPFVFLSTLLKMTAPVLLELTA